MVKDRQYVSRSQPRTGIRSGTGSVAAPTPVMEAIGSASPLVVTAALAAILLFVDLPGSTAEWPLPMLLIVAVQASGVLLARELEQPAWRRVWIMTLV